MTDAAFAPGEKVHRYWAESEGWSEEVGEVVAVGERIAREEGLDLHTYAVRWADGHESAEAEFLLAHADRVQPGTHAF